MNKRYAILNVNNEALNFVSWDGETYFDYGQDAGNKIILIPEDADYGFGWVWNGTEFINPNPVPEIETRNTSGTEEF